MSLDSIASTAHSDAEIDETRAQIEAEIEAMKYVKTLSEVEVLTKLAIARNKALIEAICGNGVDLKNTGSRAIAGGSSDKKPKKSQNSKSNQEIVEAGAATFFITGGEKKSAEDMTLEEIIATNDRIEEYYKNLPPI